MSEFLSIEPSSERSFLFEQSVLSDIGCRRKENQDAFCIAHGAKASLYLVADGMGGARGGAVASALAVNSIYKDAISSDGLVSLSSLRISMENANKLIWKKSTEHEELSGMGTTIAALAFVGKQVFVGHVGDSRIYRFCNSKLTQITRDHTLVQELVETGAISVAEAANHPIAHMLTRSLGPTENIEVEVRLLDGEVSVGERFLLCSDGLYNLVSADEIASVLKEFELDAAAKRFVNLALERGGTDNVTVELLEVLSLTESKRAAPIPTDESIFVEISKNHDVEFLLNGEKTKSEEDSQNEIDERVIVSRKPSLDFEQEESEDNLFIEGSDVESEEDIFAKEFVNFDEEGETKWTAASQELSELKIKKADQDNLAYINKSYFRMGLGAAVLGVLVFFVSLYLSRGNIRRISVHMRSLEQQALENENISSEIKANKENLFKELEEGTSLVEQSSSVDTEKLVSNDLNKIIVEPENKESQQLSMSSSVSELSPSNNFSSEEVLTLNSRSVSSTGVDIEGQVKAVIENPLDLLADYRGANKSEEILSLAEKTSDKAMSHGQVDFAQNDIKSAEIEKVRDSVNTIDVPPPPIVHIPDTDTLNDTPKRPIVWENEEMKLAKLLSKELKSYRNPVMKRPSRGSISSDVVVRSEEELSSICEEKINLRGRISDIDLEIEILGISTEKTFVNKRNQVKAELDKIILAIDQTEAEYTKSFEKLLMWQEYREEATGKRAISFADKLVAEDANIGRRLSEYNQASDKYKEAVANWQQSPNDLEGASKMGALGRVLNKARVKLEEVVSKAVAEGWETSIQETSDLAYTLQNLEQRRSLLNRHLGRLNGLIKLENPLKKKFLQTYMQRREEMFERLLELQSVLSDTEEVEFRLQEARGSLSEEIG